MKIEIEHKQNGYFITVKNVFFSYKKGRFNKKEFVAETKENVINVVSRQLRENLE